MNKPVLMVFFLVLSLFIIAPIVTISELENPVQTQTITSFNTSHALTVPINITNNAQLASQAPSGNGSSINPYIIENYVISNCAFGVTGVSIQNTDKYFILRNIRVSNCSIGFSFYNVTFGEIMNSSATTNTGTGFYLGFSTNNLLINNTATNTNDGFFLISSSNNTLTHNTDINNEYVFYIYTSPNGTLSNNIGQSNHIYDYYAVDSHGTVLSNNNFFTTFSNPITSSSPPITSSSPPITSSSTIGPSPTTNRPFIETTIFFIPLIFIVVISISIIAIVVLRSRVNKTTSNETLKNSLLLPERVNSNSVSIFCPKCGMTLLSEDYYCLNCGIKLRT